MRFVDLHRQTERGHCFCADVAMGRIAWTRLLHLKLPNPSIISDNPNP
jgi:hypothetical protein